MLPASLLPAGRWYDSVSNFLKVQYSTVLPEYRFKHTFEYCPPRSAPPYGPYGLQHTINLPICGSITVLFVLLRVGNPDLTSWYIMKLLMDLPSPSLLYLMRQFICYTRDFAEKKELRILQNFYFHLSKLLDDKQTARREERSGVMNYVDNIYHNLDFPGLVRFVSDSPLFEIRPGKLILKE